MFSTLLWTASSSIPLRLTTSNTTTLSPSYACTTGAGRPGPATNPPAVAPAAAPDVTGGAVVAGAGKVASVPLVTGATLDSVDDAVGVVVAALEVSESLCDMCVIST